MRVNLPTIPRTFHCSIIGTFFSMAETETDGQREIGERCRSLFEWEHFNPADPAGTLWDVVVVGTGIGGSTIGYSLAWRGFKVLFLERGTSVAAKPAPSLSPSQRLFRMFRRETQAADLETAHPVFVNEGERTSSFRPMVGAPGGTSTIYGAALERFRRIDFAQPRIGSDEAASLADGWPLDYDTFRSYYDKAEKLFRICGTRDPLDPDDDSVLSTPPALSELDQHFLQAFRDAGLHPYRVHVGMKYDRECMECVHTPCPRDCKADGASIALKPALVQHGAKILLGCEVQRLNADRKSIESVVAKIEGQTLKIRGRVVVLAAGALRTPLLLLNSTSQDWPNGIGNGSDLVGKGLMFHVSDIFLLPPRRGKRQSVPRKALSFRDFYCVDGRKLGTFQSVGSKIWRGDIRMFLRGWIDRNLRIKLPMTNLIVWLFAIPLVLYFRHYAIFATIIEDFPYPQNRLVPDPYEPSRVRIDYNKKDELVYRVMLMRDLIMKRLAPLKPFIVSKDVRLNFGHICGTCRFGSNPATSVLDPNNKVWGTDNLYVVDTSFFNTSAGVNPGLTIAANALRVGDAIAASLEQPGSR